MLATTTRGLSPVCAPGSTRAISYSTKYFGNFAVSVPDLFSESKSTSQSGEQEFFSQSRGLISSDNAGSQHKQRRLSK